MQDMKSKAKSYVFVALGVWGAMLASSAPGQVAGKDNYQEIITREFGTAIPAMTAIEKEIQKATPEQYPQIEAKLLAVIETPEATMPGKQFACQMLRIVGSPKCLPAVSKLLTDDKLSHMARYVMLGMKDAGVDAALRKGLGQTQGNLRIGIVHTIGDRADQSSLAAVAALLTGTDDATARAVLNAIGKIGGLAGADVLDGAKVAESLKEEWAHAYLRCAASVAAAGENARAGKMCQLLFDGDYPIQIRTGAFQALAQTQKESAVPLIVKLLSSQDAKMSRLAAMVAVNVPGSAATRAFVQELPDLAPDLKVVLLGTLMARGEAEGATAPINKLAADQNPAVRQAAIKALGRLGDASSVPVLTAAAGEGATRQDAIKALVDLQGAGVADALVKQFESGDATVRQNLLTVLGDRRQVEALPAVRKAVLDNDANIRRAALKTISALGTQADLAPLVEALLATKQEADRDAIAQALSTIGGRMQDKVARSEPVVQAMAKADAPTKIQLINVLATLGGDPALQTIRASLGGEAEVKKAAVRALADWPDAAPMADLLTVAKEDKDNQVLALRGYIRMAGLGGSAETKLESYRTALGLAAAPSEKRLVLAGLGEVSHADALKMVEASLDDADLQREAFLAYEKIAESLAGRQPAVAKEALQRVVDKSKDGNLRKKAQAALQKING
jgi:HEAT repeat protein